MTDYYDHPYAAAYRNLQRSIRWQRHYATLAAAGHPGYDPDEEDEKLSAIEDAEEQFRRDVL